MESFITIETVRNHTEECLCNYCGLLLGIGDKVYVFDDFLPYCSKVCLQADKNYRDRFYD